MNGVVQVEDVGTVVVGYSSLILGALDGHVPERSVLILEEPEMIETRDIERKAAAHPSFAGVIPTPIHRESGTPGIADVVAPPNVVAVLSPTDYGVVWAAELAEAWGLPGAGVRAARLFRDKLRLREAMNGLVRQPAWTAVESLAQMEAFAAVHPAGVVLKPSNLQGSLGVHVLHDNVGLDAAWLGCVTAAEPKYRSTGATPPRYLVESLVEGPEVSVEAFVHEGEVLFVNLTAKEVQPGLHPVELGHAVPAPGLSVHVTQALHDATAALVRGSGFRTGAIHSEWILDPEGPVLVECAGRIPGDGINDLISHAYGFDFIEAWLALLSGDLPALPRDPVSATAVALIHIPLAEDRATIAAEAARAVAGVWQVDVKPAENGTVLSSNDRNVSIYASGVDSVGAGQALEAALAAVRNVAC